ncbi:MAG: hypothetical protein FJ265_03555 [Planctomycetes bacterium]|nr:hypothetical protein [Planctomycetota bacterium]
MSTPRRLPKKKPVADKKQEIEAELPMLEPLAEGELLELPPLEPEPEAEPEAGPVQATCAPAGEHGFDFAVTVTVPAMDKQDVPHAVKGPLHSAVARAAAQLRFQRVVVRFAGEAMVGSAVKEIVAAALKPVKATRVTVRRGFGDELVHEGALPKLGVEVQTAGADTKVVFATAELDVADLTVLLPAELQKLLPAAKDRRFVFTFAGGPKPDGELRAAIGRTLREAGALRAAIGERVLFDRELENRVAVVAQGAATVVTVSPGDAASTQEALHHVLPGHGAAFAGKAVRVHFRGAAGAAERDLSVDLLRKGGAARIELGDGVTEGEIVWPKLLEVVAGAETTWRVVPNGRSRLAVLAAFRREAADAAAGLRGKALLVDWPAGFALDAEVERCLAEALGGCKVLACTVGGELREPFLPAPLVVGGDAALRTVRLDTDTGKPAELVRAIERRLPAAGAQLRGAVVRLLFAGSAPPSRTLLRTLCTAIEAAGCARLEREDRGAIDVLLPPMLAIARDGAAVRVAVAAGPRDAAQQQLAIVRELDAAELPKGTVVALSPSPATEALAAALIARGAERVRLEGPVPLQLHPALFGPPEAKFQRLVLRARPDSDPAIAGAQLAHELPGLLAARRDLPKTTVVLVWPGAKAPLAGLAADAVQRVVAAGAREVHVDGGDGKPFQVHPPVLAPAPTAAAAPAAPAAGQPAPAAPAAATGALVTVLGRRDEAVPPMVLLGIEAGTEAAHVAAVRQQLEPHLGRLRGRAVLLVLRRGGADVPVRRPDELVAMLGEVARGSAAATLVFRGPDAQGRPHFQVLHSTLRALPVGAPFGDPRQPR